MRQAKQGKAGEGGEKETMVGRSSSQPDGVQPVAGTLPAIFKTTREPIQQADLLA